MYLFNLLFSILFGAVTICLDPGHGGTSTGAIGEYIYEKDVVLQVAFHLQNMLNQVPGISFVALTRDGDYNVSLQDRSDYANSWGFDYFISIHENALNGSVQGTETFCYSLDPSDVSYQLAVPVQNRLVDCYEYTDRGVKVGDFLHVIRETEMPAILGEGSFLDYNLNWNESYLYAYNVNDHIGIQSWAYTRAICEFLGLAYPAYGNGVILIDNMSPGFMVDDSLAWSLESSGSPWMLNCASTSVESSRIASWASKIPVNGPYNVQSWWTKGFNRSSSVCYRIHHSDGYTDVFVDQYANGGGQWVPLGSFVFDGDCLIELIGSESSPGNMIADAVKLVPPLGIEEQITTDLMVIQNPASSFTFLLPPSFIGVVYIYNSIGRKIDTLYGTGSRVWIPENMPSGIYFAIESQNLSSSKLVYIQ